MSIRFTTRTRGGLVAVCVAASLALGAAGCGGNEEGKSPGASASASKDDSSDPSPQEGQSAEPMAELKGTDGLILQITSAKRDSGGFVTVNGDLKNDGAKSVAIPAQISGDETEIIVHGPSFGGATLVDSKGKKRYYVLRDTDGRPLTTVGVSTVESGQTLPVFMQFPAPPAGTSDVTLQLPTFSTASIQISG
ncbi:hypothetical protein ACIQU5_00350 [Streptomyces sp. NPDC090306]|uniref:hypothetical protein n=1 Tax=unclassified Streptomyces TaxID=2593676 RepID=UPI0036EB8900